MPQLILKPDDPPSKPAVLDGPISQQEKALKRVFDTSALLPGDLILVSELNPGWTGKAIRAVQLKGGYLEEHARWEHAAVYIGKYLICEATKSGVNKASLARYIGGHQIRARRARRLTMNERYELAIEALRTEGTKYGVREAARLWWISRGGFNHGKASRVRAYSGYPKDTVVCSQLYADSYTSVTGKVIGNPSGWEITPASLSATTELDDVQLQWLSI